MPLPFEDCRESGCRGGGAGGRCVVSVGSMMSESSSSMPSELSGSRSMATRGRLAERDRPGEVVTIGTIDSMTVTGEDDVRAIGSDSLACLSSACSA